MLMSYRFMEVGYTCAKSRIKIPSEISITLLNIIRFSIWTTTRVLFNIYLRRRYLPRILKFAALHGSTNKYWPTAFGTSTGYKILD